MREVLSLTLSLTSTIKDPECGDVIVADNLSRRFTH